MLKTVLLTQKCFCYCWAGLTPDLTWPYQWGGCGCIKGWDGTQLRQVTPANQRDIPYCVASCPAIRAGGRGEGGDIQRGGVCPPKSLLCMMQPCSSYRWLNTCLPIWCGERISCFTLLVYTAFPLPIISQHMCFLTFILLILSSIPVRGVEWGQPKTKWCLVLIWNRTLTIPNMRLKGFKIMTDILECAVLNL